MLLIEPRNPNAIAEAIIKILLDRGFAEELSTAGRKHMEERQRLETVAGQWEKVLMDAVSEYKRR